MGRTSKFFFPVPGRRASVLPSSKSDAAAPTPSSSSSSNTRPPPQRPQQPLSKAQRLLGTGDLNIDAPTRDDDGTWRSYTPSSTRSRAATSPSRMSIEIAESTTEDDAFSVSEGGVPPIRLNGKASSTLLGRGTTMRAEYGGEDMASDLPDIRSERSNSTLRSYYDRGSTPLAVSQQTSASSARDLALRKGYQPAISSMPHSPLGIDSIAEDDGSDDDRDRDNRDNRDSYYPTSPMQPPKKKTSRLDLTRLFHKKSKDSSLRPPATSRTPSIASGVSSTTDAAYSRKLSKTPPAARKKSAVASPPVDRLRDEKTVQFQSDHHATDDLWDHYEQRAYVDRSPKPETARVAKAAAAAVPVIASPRPRHEAPNGVSYPDLRPRGGHDSRDTAAPPHSAWRARDHLGGNGQNWDATSRVSDSSKTTGTSRRSVFSNSNLQQNSILSLSESSSSDDDDGVRDEKDTSESDVMGNGARRGGKRNGANKSGSSTTSSKHPTSSSTTKRQKPKPLRNLDAFPRPASSTSHPSTTTPSPHHSDFLTIPSPISPHLSGPWRSSISPPTTAIPAPPPSGPLPGVPQGVRRQASSASKASTMRSVNSSRTASTLRSTAPRSRPPVEGLPSPVSPGVGGYYGRGHGRQGSGQSGGYANGNGNAYSNGYGYSNGSGMTPTSSRSPVPAPAYPASISSSTSSSAATTASAAAVAAAANMMVVTPQEQALLSALRRKRARMRDEILAEGVLDVGTASVVNIGGGGGGGKAGNGGNGLMPRGSVRSGVSARSSGVSENGRGEGESVVFCLDDNNAGPAAAANGMANGAGGEKSIRSARSGRSERSAAFGGGGWEREEVREREAREREAREREMESFVGALSGGAAGKGGGVKGRAGVRLSAVGSVGGEGFGW